MNDLTLKMIYILSSIIGLFLMYFISMYIWLCCSKDDSYEKVEQESENANNNRDSYDVIP